MEPLGKSVEHWSQFVFAGQLMVASDPEIHPAKLFVIHQIRKTSSFSAVANVLRENAGKEQRLIPDVRSNVKTGWTIGRLQCSEHFKKVIERMRLPGNNTAHILR